MIFRANVYITGEPTFYDADGVIIPHPQAIGLRHAAVYDQLIVRAEHPLSSDLTIRIIQ
jgi:hypothetical protein